MIDTNLSIAWFRIFSLAFISRRVHSLELGMCKTQLELQDENENVSERYGKFQNIYIFGVGSFSAFNIAINFNREVFMIMILFSIFFMKNSFD